MFIKNLFILFGQVFLMYKVNIKRNEKRGALAGRQQHKVEMFMTDLGIMFGRVMLQGLMLPLRLHELCNFAANLLHKIQVLLCTLHFQVLLCTIPLSLSPVIRCNRKSCPNGFNRRRKDLNRD